jgi:hypothetical protein
MKTGATPLMAAAGVGASAQADRRGLSVLDGGRIEDEGRVLLTVTTALDLGSDVNAVNEAGDTALHGAVSLGYDAVVRVLASHGADVNLRNKRGQTPLGAIAGRRGEGVRAADRAAQTPRPSTAALLRTLGAVE